MTRSSSTPQRPYSFYHHHPAASSCYFISCPHSSRFTYLGSGRTWRPRASAIVDCPGCWDRQHRCNLALKCSTVGACSLGTLACRRSRTSQIACSISTPEEAIKRTFGSYLVLKVEPVTYSWHFGSDSKPPCYLVTWHRALVSFPGWYQYFGFIARQLLQNFQSTACSFLEVGWHPLCPAFGCFFRSWRYPFAGLAEGRSNLG